MLQLLNGPKTGQCVHLVTGLQHSCLSNSITDIQDLSRVNGHVIHAHGIRQITQTPLPNFGSKYK